MRRRILLTAVVVGIPLALAAVGAVATVGPRNLVGMALYDQREEGHLAVGDAAPDVRLLLPDGVTSRALLAEHRPDRPLVVVFGSFT